MATGTIEPGGVVMPANTKLPRPFTMHWGSGLITEEARFEGEHHVPAIQLMDYTEGEAAGSWTIRFCSFNHRGAFQRSPLILSEEDIAQMREALKKTPRLREILRLLVAD
jgi:hypothetical protein